MRRLVPVVLLLVLWAPAAHAWTWPVDGPVLQPFSFDPNDPYAGGQHRGVDIGAASTGSDVLAPASGTVSYAGTLPTNGITVTIATGDGYVVTLTHLGSRSVARGDTVVEGDSIGSVGPSGTPEVDGPYLHLGIRVVDDSNGYLDPLSLLPVAPAAADSGAASSDTTDGTDTTPAETTPADTAPDPTTAPDTAPAETAPADTAPAEAAPAGTVPADAPTADTTPAETAGVDATPADTAFAGGTATDTPSADTTPADTTPAEAAPADTAAPPAAEPEAPDALRPATSISLEAPAVLRPARSPRERGARTVRHDRPGSVDIPAPAEAPKRTQPQPARPAGSAVLRRALPAQPAIRPARAPARHGGLPLVVLGLALGGALAAAGIGAGVVRSATRRAPATPPEPAATVVQLPPRESGPNDREERCRAA